MANLPTNSEELRAAVKGKSDADILALVKDQEVAAVQTVFDIMPTRFDAAKAGNQNAVFQFDLDTPAGMQQHHVIVEAGKVQTVKGPAPKAKCILKCNLPTFFRMMSGELDGQKAFMSGVLKISGDVMFSRNIQIWFKP